jgi:hypothetical protein
MPWYGVVIAMLSAAGAALAWLHFMQRGYPRFDAHEQDESQDPWREPVASRELAVEPERSHSEALSVVTDEAGERPTPLLPSVHEAPTREFAVQMPYTNEFSVHTRPTLEFAVPAEDMDEEFILLEGDESGLTEVRLPTETTNEPRARPMSGLPPPSRLAWESTRPASGIQPQARVPVVSRVPLVTNSPARVTTTSGYAMRGEEIDSGVIEIRSGDRKKNRSA